VKVKPIHFRHRPTADYGAGKGTGTSVLETILVKDFVDIRGIVPWAQHNNTCQALSWEDTYGLMENHFLGSPYLEH